MISSAVVLTLLDERHTCTCFKNLKEEEKKNEKKFNENEEALRNIKINSS